MTTAEKLAKIMELSVQINSETELAVFCNFSGHVNLLHVRVALSKELADEVLVTGNWFIGLDKSSKLDECISSLEFIREHHCIPQSLTLEGDIRYQPSGQFYKTKLSQGCNLNESTLQNTSTESYLSIRESVKEA